MEDRSRATECLTLAIAHEAGFESTEGQQAVAEVILNRLRSPSFPKTICDVVFAGSNRRTGCQFTFTCDGSLSRRLPDRVMIAARSVAEDALAGRAPSRVPGATHYHADYVHPYWAPSLVRITRIGAHIFYHAPGATAPGGSILALADDAVTPAARTTGRNEVFAPWGLPANAAVTPPPR
ncbi:MAG TPA: cell wall hydrolase [Sphingobium sp.]|uniref:cell wall hydrolase n=1 Tax=Sphingobium sp. TaxID=1912891 RepID=UPI002ED3B6BE